MTTKQIHLHPWQSFGDYRSHLHRDNKASPWAWALSGWLPVMGPVTSTLIEFWTSYRFLQLMNLLWGPWSLRLPLDFYQLLDSQNLNVKRKQKWQVCVCAGPGEENQWYHALTPLKYSFVTVHSPRTTVGPDDRTDRGSVENIIWKPGLGTGWGLWLSCPPHPPSTPTQMSGIERKAKTHCWPESPGSEIRQVRRKAFMLLVTKGSGEAIGSRWRPKKASLLGELTAPGTTSKPLQLPF